MKIRQLYTVIDKKTGETLFDNKTSDEIAEQLGVTKKRVSAWATDGCRQYIVKTQLPKSKRAKKMEQLEHIKNRQKSIDDYSILARKLGISYGKLKQIEMIREMAIKRGEIKNERVYKI